MRFSNCLFLAIAGSQIFVAAACTEDAIAPVAGDNPTLPVVPATTNGIPCDVDGILERSCRTCHGKTPLYGAPMSLATREDVMPVAARVKARISDAAKPMPPAPNVRLSASDVATVSSWIDGGLPRSSEVCNSVAPARPSTQLSCAPDVRMRPTQAWSMPDDEDDVYVCYGFDVTAAQKRHLTAIAPVIEDPAIVHHLVLFEAPSAVSPVPSRCAESSVANMQPVYGWAPGGKPLELPKEAGFAQEGTIHYVVQIHYNNVRHQKNHSDGSGFDFCTTTELRPNDAGSFVLGTIRINIPPRSTLDMSCDYTIGGELAGKHVFSAMPHMHQLGTSIGSTLHHAGSAPIDLGTRAAWSFEDQPYVPVNATLAAGDHVVTRCAWNNPTDHDVAFGPNTADEMCFAYTMYYPKVESQQWSWMMPAAMARCKETK